jgi:putative MATE family efflux protein
VSSCSSQIRQKLCTADVDLILSQTTNQCKPENSVANKELKKMIATKKSRVSKLPTFEPAALDAPAISESRELRRRVWGLAGPVIGENFLETLLGIIDTLLVAGLGAVAIPGVGSALQIMFLMISALSALAIGSSVLVAQAIGAGDTARASQLGRQSLIWSVLFSIPLSLVGLLLSGPIIGMFGLEPAVAQIGTQYLQVTMGTVVVLVALFIGGGVLRGAGDGRTPLRVTALANLVNLVLAYGLIGGHFGLPALGAVGSAWATFLARTLALVLLVAALWRGRNGVAISGRGGWRPDFKVARQVLGIGIPAALEQVLATAAFLALALVVARLGTDVLAAQRITFNALSLSFLPGIGFGIAATALVGQSIGAQRIGEGAAAARVATKWAVIWMSAIAALLIIFAPQIVALFTSDAAVLAEGVPGLRVLALTQPFWAVLFVQSGALRGTGNTRFPLLVTGSSIWAAVGLAFVLIETVGGGLVSIWAAFLAVAPLMALLVWRRFRRTVDEF